MSYTVENKCKRHVIREWYYGAKREYRCINCMTIFEFKEVFTD